MQITNNCSLLIFLSMLNTSIVRHHWLIYTSVAEKNIEKTRYFEIQIERASKRIIVSNFTRCNTIELLTYICCQHICLYFQKAFKNKCRQLNLLSDQHFISNKEINSERTKQTELCKDNKDSNMLLFYKPPENTFVNMRHKYNNLCAEVSENFQQLRRLTKHLRKFIDHKNQATTEFRSLLSAYMAEEPLLSNGRSLVPGSTRQSATRTTNQTDNGVTSDDETIELNLPKHLQDEEENGKQDDKVRAHVGLEEWMSHEWKMTCLEEQFWLRVDKELHEPLYSFRKSAITKLQSLTETVATRYDRMIKYAQTTKQEQIKALNVWNELCDCRSRLKKAKNNKRDTKKVNKHTERVNAACKKFVFAFFILFFCFEKDFELLITTNKQTKKRTKTQFETVVEHVDKLNDLVDEFWNDVVKDGCEQLEAMEATRCAFMVEFVKKFNELLCWKYEAGKV
ncbi:hypothetical protein RFI_19750 [Reticulomyxa filosa]|uniref:Uncharacterized protein n=1 Tax=Reticulomyxa filosa TaxID=46433 RepID=X6MWV8_RETFI|nr:hypothetical protein RFI_19750 [Reticulomyxa filosa]|eukprot:ETO17570.1 hypothetical protein RFI_19750 [Reticulomyxa filosa]